MSLSFDTNILDDGIFLKTISYVKVKVKAYMPTPVGLVVKNPILLQGLAGTESLRARHYQKKKIVPYMCQ